MDQSHTNTEVIVVDDGSTDQSMRIIQSFGERIQYETGPNRGGNFARNRLLELSSGEWVQFLDSDDYLKPDKVASQLNSLNENPDADVIYSPLIAEVWNEKEMIESSLLQTETTDSIEEQWISWQLAQTGSVLWKSRSLKAIGGWNESYPCCQDNEVILRAIQNGLVFHYSKHPSAVYRIWSEETVCRKDPSRVIQFKTGLIDEMLDWLKKHDRLSKSHVDSAGQAFFEMARTLAKTDLERATEYVSVRKQQGPFFARGPAAPSKYRFLFQTVGFKNAERIAGFLRK